MSNSASGQDLLPLCGRMHPSGFAGGLYEANNPHGFGVESRVAGGAATAWAHHSFAAAFDMNKPVTVQGTIVQVRLENPHSWFSSM